MPNKHKPAFGAAFMEKIAERLGGMEVESWSAAATVEMYGFYPDEYVDMRAGRVEV